MFLSSSLLVVALCTLLGESSASILPLSKRWDTTLCTAETSGVPIPDADNFQLPQENLRQDMCWDLCVGDQATCTTKTKICYDFVGSNLTFNYNPIAGYNYTEADIWLGLAAPSSTTPTPRYTTSNKFCTISADQTTVQCEIPYNKIPFDTTVAGDVLLDVLKAMCPNGAQAGYIFYLYTNAKLTSASGEVSATGRLSCTDYPACTSYYSNTYWELTYRCTNCPYTAPTPSATPTDEYCSVSTA